MQVIRHLLLGSFLLNTATTTTSI